jgi:hypothetical protein
MTTVRNTRVPLDDAHAQYEAMRWPEVREKVSSQTKEIAADVEMRQSISMKDHLAKVEALATGDETSKMEASIVQNVNAQKNLLEESLASNKAFNLNHADISREKQ